MTASDRLREWWALAARRTAADFSNFHLLHYRRIDGFLVTAKNSGTHWLKYMISHALSAELGLPPPLHASGRSANDFVGHPKWPRKYRDAPHIGSSHNLPSALFAAPPVFRALKLPPIVVLVRDIEQAMLSHHVKWRAESGLQLTDYVDVPAPGRKLVADVWWYIDFFNRWGRMATRFPDHILLVRYEDLRADQPYWLERILRHYGFDVCQASIDGAIAASEREAMRARLDPNAGELIIPADAERGEVRFSDDERTRLQERLGSHLKHSFGYGYRGEARLPAARAAETGRASAA